MSAEEPSETAAQLPEPLPHIEAPPSKKKGKLGRKLSDVWRYYMEDPSADVDEFRSKNMVSTMCPVCEHTISHWGKADRLKVFYYPLTFSL